MSKNMDTLVETADKNVKQYKPPQACYIPTKSHPPIEVRLTWVYITGIIICNEHMLWYVYSLMYEDHLANHCRATDPRTFDSWRLGPHS